LRQAIEWRKRSRTNFAIDDADKVLNLVEGMNAGLDYARELATNVAKPRALADGWQTGISTIERAGLRRISRAGDVRGPDALMP
jgi:hypothetical protein